MQGVLKYMSGAFHSNLFDVLWPKVVEEGAMNTAEMMRWLSAKGSRQGLARVDYSSMSMNRFAQIVRSCGLFVCVGKERDYPPQGEYTCALKMRQFNVYEPRPLNDITEPYVDETRHPIRRLNKQPKFVRTEVKRRLKND